MSDTEYACKLDEMERLLNDPDVCLDADRVWSLMAEIAAANRTVSGTERG
jgi:hypothetical protein